jgi:peptidoglycan/xylan/chitin deacetylase (PgdA/CDA1 family)
MRASFNGWNTLGNATRMVMGLASRALWRAPGRFAIARMFGPAYSLRCVVFHDVSAAESPFTKGMGVSISPGEFEAALKLLVRHYTPVSLQDVLADPGGRKLRQPAILVTFDDGYASTLCAREVCREFGVPAVFFLNASILDNKRLAPDNLVCYAANVSGMEVLNRAARAVKGSSTLRLVSMVDVFQRFFPLLSLDEKQAFLDSLSDLAGIDERALAGQASLYLTSAQVRELASAGFEIGNHTYTHVHCRSLAARDFTGEIDRNKAELEAIAQKPLRSFSVPYGSSADLNRELVDYLARSAYEVAFLSESVANTQDSDRLHLDRVSIRTGSDHRLFLEIEILPRLRALRNRLFERSTSSSTKAQAGCRLAATSAEHPIASLERTQN